MRTLSLSLVLVSFLTGCASTLSDPPSGYPGFPAAPSSARDPASGAVLPKANADARDVLGAPRAPEPRTFEPKFVMHEIVAREPPRHTDFVECWQCRVR